MSRPHRPHKEKHLVNRIGWLRAAILGANDGIISTASLRMVGRKEKYGSISAEKVGARLASPQPRPASPVNGAGGITGC
jgi:VIT1/CCC1 family predicted Fe2+/Mn2+ transporter